MLIFMPKIRYLPAQPYYMKKFLYCAALITCFAATAQKKERNFGISIGVNEYFARPDFISAKSSTGFSIGIVSGYDVTDKSDIVIEAGFAHLTMKFMGNDFGNDNTRWLDFHNNRLFLNLLYYYDVYHSDGRDFIVGVHGGVGTHYINNFAVKGKDNAAYTLEPYGIDALDMKISKYTDGAEFNPFLSAGINMRYKFAEVNLRYYKGLTSPYRSLGNDGSPVKFGGVDDYMSLTFNFYFDADF